MSRKGKKPKWAKKIAKERIVRLLKLAEEEARRGNYERASRYVWLARRIGMKYNVRIPRRLKRRICKGCLSFMIPGVNCRVRVSRGRIVITCLRCGRVKRIPYKPRREVNEGRSVQKGLQEGSL